MYLEYSVCEALSVVFFFVCVSVCLYVVVVFKLYSSGCLVVLVSKMHS